MTWASRSSIWTPTSTQAITAARRGSKIAFSIGSDNVEAGRKAADFMAEQLGADAKGPILVIEGLAGNITGQKRAQGFKDEIAKKAPGLKVVASLPGDWDANKAANITNDTLQRNPDLWASSPPTTPWRLARSSRSMRPARAARSPSSASTATADGVKSIKAGRLTASVAQLPYLEGITAVKDVKKVTAPARRCRTSSPCRRCVLTKDVLEANKRPEPEIREVSTGAAPPSRAAPRPTSGRAFHGHSTRKSGGAASSLRSLWRCRSGSKACSCWSC